MKIFAASLMHETLASELTETTKADFEDVYLTYDGNHPSLQDYWVTPVYRWRELSLQNGHQFVESISALAHPSGPVATKTFEEFTDRIVADLKKHHQSDSPVDLILLNLHGAMVAVGYDDCEGFLLASLREIVGKKALIGVVMDLHAHHTPEKANNSDVIIYYHEYPHTDVKESAEELFEIMQRAGRKEIQPAIYTFNTHMLNHILTIREPMQSIVRFMEQQIDSKEGIETISIAHGFPWADVPCSGVMPVIVFNKLIPTAEKRAQEIGKQLGLMLYKNRDAIKPQTHTIEQALALIKPYTNRLQSCPANQQPFILADYADNPGGGALCLSIFILEHLLKNQIPYIGLSSLCDHAAVDLAFQNGIKAEFILDLGGSHDPQQQPYYGHPLKVKARVIALEHNFQDEFAGGNSSIGDAARLQILEYFDGKNWLQQIDCDVIVNKQRAQTFSPKCFTGFGIDVKKKILLVVKSMFHYQAAFKKITAQERLLTIAAKGRLTPNLKELNYKKLAAQKMWPIAPQLSEFERELRL